MIAYTRPAGIQHAIRQDKPCFGLSHANFLFPIMDYRKRKHTRYPEARSLRTGAWVSVQDALVGERSTGAPHPMAVLVHSEARHIEITIGV